MLGHGGGGGAGTQRRQLPQPQSPGNLGNVGGSSAGSLEPGMGGQRGCAMLTRPKARKGATEAEKSETLNYRCYGDHQSLTHSVCTVVVEPSLHIRQSVGCDAFHMLRHCVALLNGNNLLGLRPTFRGPWLPNMAGRTCKRTHNPVRTQPSTSTRAVHLHRYPKLAGRGERVRGEGRGGRGGEEEDGEGRAALR